MPSAPADLLKITGLAKRFRGGGGVSDVFFSVPAGAVTGFIGVNGAGKSTTLRCALGLLKPDAGQVSLFGAPFDLTARRRVGFLPEERGLFAHERARDAIGFHGRLKGMTRKEALASADRLLERVGLGARKNDRIASLSKGNAQRVQVLAAMVHDPELLLLDEPLSGLDPIAQSELLSLLAAFRARGGGILFSTHSLAAAESICDRVVMLSAGRTIFEGGVPDASALAPHGAIVVTADAEGLGTAAAMLGGHIVPVAGAMGEVARWRVVLPRHITHPVLIRALSERRVPIFAFEPIKPGLEGAFWHLAQSLPESRAA
ncbi:MAG: ATP-binding cassette domain-containing protein [Alphaproteobacteria bacterium]|nr:ATP-binding cassette domain-containing protein [Alphaproteobacteria bacterium]